MGGMSWYISTSMKGEVNLSVVCVSSPYNLTKCETISTKKIAAIFVKTKAYTCQRYTVAMFFLLLFVMYEFKND